MALEMRDRYLGCLLAGAVGDALGAAIEFLSLSDIHRQYGDAGLTDYDDIYGRRGAITDDTQMTLFTVEGILRGDNRWHDRGLCDQVGVMHNAYIRWLHTQGQRSANGGLDTTPLLNGWLIEQHALHARRAPGITCLTALQSGKRFSTAHPGNNSKGCGGVMRVAPVGLSFREPDQAFEFAMNIAALTHGHPSGYLAAGFLAALINRMMLGQSLREAIEETLRYTRQQPRSAEVCQAVSDALYCAEHKTPSPETIKSLGEGWVAEEALAIALYCALKAKDIASGLLLAVNHGGDSDSTGSITGNILGVMHGYQAIPINWLSELELREVIEEMAKDLYLYMNANHVREAADYEKYPPN